MNENLYEMPEDINAAERRAAELWQGYLEAEKFLTQLANSGLKSPEQERLFLVCNTAKQYAKKQQFKKDPELEATLESCRLLYKESEKQLEEAHNQIKSLQEDKQMLEQTVQCFREDKKALMRTIEIQVLGE